MGVDNFRRRLSASLWGLIALGLIASISMTTFVSWQQSLLADKQVRFRTIEKDINLDLEKLRRLTLETHLGIIDLLTNKQTKEIEANGHNLGLLIQETNSLVRKYPFHQLNIAFNALQKRSLSASQHWRDALAWKRNTTPLYADMDNEFTLDRARTELEKIKETIDILKGRFDLQSAVLMRNWQDGILPKQLETANQLLELQNSNWPRIIKSLTSDLREMDLLTEQIATEQQFSQLQRLKEIRYHPLLLRLTDSVELLHQNKDLFPDITLPQLNSFRQVLEGPTKNQDTLTGHRGLFKLVGDYERSVEQQQELINSAYQHLDQSNMTISFLDELTENFLHLEQTQSELQMKQTIKQGLIWIASLLVVFLFLGWLLSGQIKQQFNLLSKLKRRNDLILNSAGEGVIGIDTQGITVFINPAAAGMLLNDAENLIGKDIHQIWLEDESRPVEQILSGQHQSIHSQEGSFIRSDGLQFPVEFTIMPIIHGKMVEGAVLTFMDITASKQAKVDLLNSERQFRDLSEKSLIGVYIIQDNIFTYANPRMAEIFGYPRHEIENILGPKELTNPDDWLMVKANIAERMSGDSKSINYFFNGVTKQGEVINLEVYGNRSIHNNKPAIIGTLLDITERTKIEAKIQQQAYYDQLTGLPNRVLFMDRLKHSVISAKRNDTQMAVLFLDLDRFKHINDSLGHPVGDAMLASVAGRLNNSVRENDTVARLGGDEFTIILENLSNNHEPATVASKILEQLNQPFSLSGHDLFISASIGICLYPDDGTDADALISNADAAMYRAKQKGRSTYSFYTTQLTTSSVEWLELETDLRKAINQRQLHLAYQPQIDIKTEQLIGVEALLRWNHPQKGNIPPDRFIPLAEETNLILEIGEWVLLESCKQMQRWQTEGLAIKNMAVNISPIQIERGNLYEAVQTALYETGLDPKLLELEITENSIMHNPDHCIAVLTRLRDLGVSLSIDDFGTGYSSLNQLKKLPIHKLKIDQSFISDVTEDKDNAAITKAIINMGRLLRLEVIAEGVETEQQRQFVAANGCDIAQGYFFSKPLSAADCEQFLELQHERHSSNIEN